MCDKKEKQLELDKRYLSEWRPYGRKIRIARDARLGH